MGDWEQERDGLTALANDSNTCYNDGVRCKQPHSGDRDRDTR